MLRTTLSLPVSLLAAAILCMGAAPAPPGPAKPSAAAKAAPARKPAAKPPAKTPARTPTRPAAATSGFDASDPAVLVALLASVDAQAQIARREADAVYLTVTSQTGSFSTQFAGCNAQGKACQAVLFDRPGVGAPTLAQVNGFNQTSVMCRAYQDKAGKVHVEYSALIFPRNTREEMLMHLNAWRGCLADFDDFSKDPIAFLANAA
jgi:hypothetical protein